MMIGKLAFIFPGQGSQTVGMGKDLYDNFKAAREVFQEADDALSFRISSLCFEGPESELKLTINTQPAILAVSVAALSVLKTELDCNPSFLAGHSLGEYSALVAADSFQFADAIRLVRQRGKYMQEAVPPGVGSMAAILGMKEDVIIEICREAAGGQVVAPVNYNSPEQIVISGHKEAVMRAVDLAREKGAKKAIILPVSGPFHSSLMEPAAKKMVDELKRVTPKKLKIPVISNVEAEANAAAEKVADLLIKQLTHPVRWKESMEKMVSEGVGTVIEVGPGRILTGLMRKINKKINTLLMGTTDNLNDIQKNIN